MWKPCIHNKCCPDFFFFLVGEIFERGIECPCKITVSNALEVTGHFKLHECPMTQNMEGRILYIVFLRQSLRVE